MSKTKRKTLYIYALDYSIKLPFTGEYYEGCAIVKADSIVHAQSTFKSTCTFNGYQNDIVIGKIKQIYPSIDDFLVSEVYVEQK